MGNMMSTVERRQRDTMRMLHTYIDRFPVATTTIRAILGIRPGDPRIADEIERIAATDPMLTVKLLYLANHSFLGMQDAGVTLGSVLSHVGSDAVVSTLKDANSTTALSPTRVAARDLWHHSTHVAAVAANFCKHATDLGIKPGEAYLAGLVHDLGRFILMVAAPAAFDRVEAAEWRGGVDLLREETEILGFNHAVLGWLANRAWNFPDSLAAVCRHHHEWSTVDPARYARRTLALIRVVGLADEIAFVWERDPNSARDLSEVMADGERHFRHFYGPSTSLGAAEECERILAKLDPGA